MITALAGGVGASKIPRRVEPGRAARRDIDHRQHGRRHRDVRLYIAPDLDIVTYTLAGAVNPETGWGLAGDTLTVSNNSSATRKPNAGSIWATATWPRTFSARNN